MANKLIIYIFLIITGLFFSCKKKTDPAAPTTPDLIRFNKVDVLNAVGFYSKTINVGTSSTGNQIYKILPDGTSQKIQYYKNDVVYQFATELKLCFEMNSDYLIIASYGNSVLVRKSDGMAKEFTGLNYYAYPVQLSDPNTIYFIENQKVCRISNPTLDAVTVETVSADGDQVDHLFAVDNQGNLIYAGLDKNNTSIFKLKKTDGSYQSIPHYANKLISNMWVGYDNNLYFCSPGYYSLNRLIDVKKVIQSPVDTIAYYNNPTNGYFAFYTPTFRIKNKSKIFGIFNQTDCPACGDYKFTEIYNPSKQLNNFRLSDYSIATLKAYAPSDDYLYVAGVDNTGKNVIVKIDTDLKTYTTVFNDNNYDVSLLKIDKNENIIFGAVRLSDGKSVLARVDHSSGALSIIDDQLDGFDKTTLTMVTN